MSIITRWALAALGCSLLPILGCAADSTVATSTPGQEFAQSIIELNPPFQRANGIVEGAVALGVLTVDADAVTASWETLPTRAGADNDAVFALPLNAFFRQTSYYISKVRKTEDSLQITYSINHPFPSSEISNRADLGFSGMVLFAFDVLDPAPFTWFTGDSNLITDPRWITNADGYYQYKGLLDDPGYETNAWPYKVLVSEADGFTRVDPASDTPISSGSDSRGNHGAPKGWISLLPTIDWTGYGVLHQGQGAVNTIDISLAMLAGNGPIEIKSVLAAKYADPKSGTPGFEHRLPPPLGEGQADDVVTKFGYRMPHGALDVPFAEYIGPSEGWSPNIESTSTLRFRVVDWDARSTETTAPSLREETDATKVGQGESGIPELAVCIPGVLGTRSTVVDLPNAPTDDDSAYDGDVAEDSGRERDDLFFAVDVPKPAGTGQADGQFLAWLRVSDVEGDGQAGYITPLFYDLTPSTGEFPSPVTYHPFLVRMGPPCPAPTGVGWATAFGSVNNHDYGPAAIGVDSAGNVYTAGNFSDDTDFGGGVRVPAGSEDWFLAKSSPTGTYLWDKTWGGSDYEELVGLVIDSQDRVWLGGRHSGSFDLGGGPLNANSDDDLVLARFSSAGVHQFSAQYGETQFSNLRQLAIGPADEILMVGYCYGRIDFGAGPHNTNGGEDIVVANFNPNGTLKWSKMFGGSGADYGYSASMASTGDVYVCGSFTNSVNFGVATEITAGGQDAFLLKLGAIDGAPEWVQGFGGTDFDRGYRVVVTGANRITMGGDHVGPIDLGGGELPGLPTAFDLFLAQYNASGTHRWSHSFTNDTVSGARIYDLIGNDTGDLILAGELQGPISLGGPLMELDSTQDGFLTRFSGEGVWIWDGQIGGPNGDSGVNAAVWSGATTLHHAGYIEGDAVDVDPSCARTLIDVDFQADHYISRMTANGGW